MQNPLVWGHTLILSGLALSICRHCEEFTLVNDAAILSSMALIQLVLKLLNDSRMKVHK